MRASPWLSLAGGLLTAALNPDLAVGIVPQNQSPINIVTTIRMDLTNPVFNYPAAVRLYAESIPVKAGTPVNSVMFPPALPPGQTESAMQIEFTALTVPPLPDPPDPANATVTIGADAYKLKELHFHQRSEHRLNNHQFPMELHMVHYHTADQWLVDIEDENDPRKKDIRWLAVGRWIALGQVDNVELEEVFDDLLQDDALPGSDFDFNLSSLKPNDLRHYRYEGSLTTGPNPSPTAVSWMVMHEPLRLSKDQITRFRDHDSRGTVRMYHPLGLGHYVTTNVPEPSTLWLVGIIGLIAVRQFRQR